MNCRGVRSANEGCRAAVPVLYVRLDRLDEHSQGPECPHLIDGLVMMLNHPDVITYPFEVWPFHADGNGEAVVGEFTDQREDYFGRTFSRAKYAAARLRISFSTSSRGLSCATRPVRVSRRWTTATNSSGPHRRRPARAVPQTGLGDRQLVRDRGDRLDPRTSEVNSALPETPAGEERARTTSFPAERVRVRRGVRCQGSS